MLNVVVVVVLGFRADGPLYMHMLIEKHLNTHLLIEKHSCTAHNPPAFDKLCHSGYAETERKIKI